MFTLSCLLLPFFCLYFCCTRRLKATTLASIDNNVPGLHLYVFLANLFLLKEIELILLKLNMIYNSLDYTALYCE